MAALRMKKPRVIKTVEGIPPGVIKTEKILRLAAGEDAPPGYEIRRLLGSYEVLTGPGTNFRTVYVVVARALEEL
jgi:hypothetical protein